MMKKIVLFYGLAMAVLIFMLKYIEYSFFVRDLSTEFYTSLIAVVFTGLGIWVGLRLTQKKNVVRSNELIFNELEWHRFGISKREHEVLELIAKGFSNQEIADKLFVSLNTVKTHASNLFLKLEVSRRTQAISKAKEMRLIP